MSGAVFLRTAITHSRRPLQQFIKQSFGRPTYLVYISHKLFGHKITMQQITPKTVKLDTPEFRSIFTPELEVLGEMFKKHNYELRIAGGAVRDLLLGKVPHDIDFATTATPGEMKEMFTVENIRMLNMNGEKHGTITARINDKDNFECTTLRIDIRTDGRHAQVEWTKEWQLDALRRDLTVNSLFLGLDGTVYDYFNGMEDLKQQRIRFVGTASDRIQEDYLRILRYFRFFGRIVDDPESHEEDTLRGIRDNVDGMKKITGERIWMEFKKILTGRHAESLIPVMIETGIAPYIGLPSDLNLDEYRLVCRRSEGMEPQPTTRLAALLKAADDMYAVNERLKMSREELRNGLFMIEHRNDVMGTDHLRYCQVLHCDTAAKEPKMMERILELFKYHGDAETIALLRDWKPLRLPVNGKHLMDSGVPKGRAVACALLDLRQKWKESNFSLTKEELLGLLDDVRSSRPAKKTKKETY